MTDDQLSPHFKRSEFHCPCGCGFDEVDPELIEKLERFREAMGGHRIMILSGCRCVRHNAVVGGSVRSQHLKGRAADLFPIDDGLDLQSPESIRAAIASGFTGIGQGCGKFHVDVRPGSKPVRWRYANKV